MFLPFAHFQKVNFKPYVDPISIGALNSSGAIYSVIQVGNTIFLGGDFTSIGGVVRNGIAAIDSVTGNLLPFFQGTGGVGGINFVSSFHYTGSMLLVGGAFSSLGGISRNGIAAIDPSNANVLSWYPSGGLTSTGFTLYTFCQKGNILYVAGSFTSISGVQRARIAALDLSNASVLPWYPTSGAATGYPKKLFLSEDGNTLYVGGSFQKIGGLSKARLAAVDATTGEVLSFTPPSFLSSSTSVPYISCLAQSGSKLFIGGEFSSVAGQTRSGFAVLDATTGSLLSNYPNGGFSSPTAYKSFVLKNSFLYIGGWFDSVGGQVRNGIAALDSNSLNVLSWYPPGGLGGPNASIYNFSPCGPDSIWVNGYFNSIGGVMRNANAKLNLF
ncbi:hypothetical protein [Leptospira alexanderi]|uniref:PQQ-like domain protein n=1 Tax=Leptospira alexanderi serovar Manhao 3 str. L 60 TaxID=1049759 RepID=V6HWR4_9LEPT|nr:hypothetical protein [Leptospira alexanderi]EQA61432.1 hypothetical protein LEP1GSC062_4311 [Leptospira alexanderi serovar Manhao 3 str. L 60]